MHVDERGDPALEEHLSCRGGRRRVQRGEIEDQPRAVPGRVDPLRHGQRESNGALPAGIEDEFGRRGPDPAARRVRAPVLRLLELRCPVARQIPVGDAHLHAQGLRAPVAQRHGLRRRGSRLRLELDAQRGRFDGDLRGGGCRGGEEEGGEKRRMHPDAGRQGAVSVKVRICV